MSHSPEDDRFGLLHSLAELLCRSSLWLLLRRLFATAQAPRPGDGAPVVYCKPSDPSLAATISPLTTSGIFARIAAAPPMQVAALGKRYEGRPLEAQAYFADARELQNGLVKVKLDATSHSVGNVFCTVALSKYPALEFLRKGTPVRIRGVISRVRENAITLRQAELFIPFGVLTTSGGSSAA